MLTTDKMMLLQRFLGSLPGDVAGRLASAIEIDRLVDGKALPHELILDGLRPVLRGADARKRTPTPLRLFCQPFEDLLSNVLRKEKQRGRLFRGHIIPIWQWVSRDLVVAEAKTYGDDIRRLAVRGKYTEALARAEVFWPIAGTAMTEALKANRKKAALALGGEAVAADAEDIAAVLRSGSAMLAVQALLERNTPALNEELLWGLRGIYDAVVETNLDAAPLVSVVAMRRLAKPWEALKLPRLVARQTTDALISSTDMGLAGEVLFADMDDAREAIMNLRHPHFDIDVLIANLASFTTNSTAIVKELEILRAGKWGQRLLKERAAVGGVMDTFMERAPKEIMAALPTHKAGYSGGPRVPDLNKPVDPDKVDRAMRYGKVLANTKLYSVPGSFGAKHQNAVDEVTSFLRSYTEDLLKELRSAEGPRQEVAQAQFQLVLDLTVLLFEPSDADFVRRRGKAAGALVEG
ncbi:hypothetical protein FHS83_000935 [Rhizomicrobium palustre]|uniref:Uncharacterized protein n=1 Tax=Rhizomicrobium palustre TaxID=189966 RepID=A0A846MXA5_9PROT|nr:hypothetical protein [Rhizomicrobium palustre]NIK87617.1 hypothetical protein [Rhizomicrobium palustre]